MMRIDLAIPGLLPDHEFIRAALQDTRLPALETLLVQAAPRPASPARGLSNWLGADFPAARLEADGGDAGDGIWLGADPVHLPAREGRLYVVDARTFAISRDEADALVGALNEHFSGDGLQWVAPLPQRWYLRLPTPLRITTTAPDEAAGRSVDERLPRGPDAMRVHALLNEMQMLLFTHPVNEARETRGEVPVNSVWLWDAAENSTDYAGWDVVFSDAPGPRGLAVNRGLPVHPLPEDGRALPDARHLLVVLDALDAPAAYADPAAWRDSLLEMEARWFSPLVRALRSGRIESIEIHAIGDDPRCFRCRRSDRLRFWRRPKKLAAWRPTPRE